MCRFKCKCKMIADKRLSNHKHREKTVCTCSHQTQNLCANQNGIYCVADGFASAPKCNFFERELINKQDVPMCLRTKEY